MKSKFLNFKLNKVMETNLDTACEKLNMSRSDIGRLALSMLFEAYLEPVDMGRQEIVYQIEPTNQVEKRDIPFTEEQLEIIVDIVTKLG